jgi:hypothetical protein
MTVDELVRADEAPPQLNYPPNYLPLSAPARALVSVRLRA